MRQERDNLNQEKDILRNTIIEQIKKGNFDKLYLKIKGVLPLSIEERQSILGSWRVLGLNDLIFFYYLGILGNDEEAIIKSDLARFRKINEEKDALNREKIVYKILEGDCIGNLSELLISIGGLYLNELQDIIYFWNITNNEALDIYGEAFLSYDEGKIKAIDRKIQKDREEKHVRG